MGKKHFIIPIFVPHYGCPHQCVFCNQVAITGKENDRIDGEYVKKTIEEYLKTLPTEGTVIEVSFFGGTFTAIPELHQKELLEVAKAYKDNNKIQYIRLSTRPDYIDERILDYLKYYTVDIIELGVQSMDKDVLLKSGRGHSPEDVVKATNLIKAYGFTLGIQIMVGLPGDTFDKDIYTTNAIINLKPSLCRIYPTLVVKDTMLENMYNQGTFIPYTLEEAINISKILYIMLLNSGITVIRIGLQPTAEINEGSDLVAGPFHPSFRELVEGSIFNDVILYIINTYFQNSVRIEIGINPKDISKLYAKSKYYFKNTLLALKYKTVSIVQVSNLENNRLYVKDDINIKTFNIFDIVNIF